MMTKKKRREYQLKLKYYYILLSKEVLGFLTILNISKKETKVLFDFHQTSRAVIEAAAAAVMKKEIKDAPESPIPSASSDTNTSAVTCVGTAGSSAVSLLLPMQPLQSNM
mmetsp:Transcript_45460/g.46026  ORF Transcript_45460/g.46026 Transcript_45460/m.46026 type:complete len:110 (-) Transcript_45460:975-1304(-)